MSNHMQHKALVKKSSKTSLNLKISKDLDDQIKECRIKAGERDFKLDISNLVEEFLQSEIAAINNLLEAMPEAKKTIKKKPREDKKSSTLEPAKQPEKQPVQTVDSITSGNTTPTNNPPNTNSVNFLTSSLNDNDHNNT